MAKYSYSATKTDGKFSGGVFAVNDDGTTETLTFFEGIKTKRGVKGIAKAEAVRHRELTRNPDTHSESHTVYGSLEL